MKIRIIAVAVALLPVLLIGAVELAELPEARVTVQVVDEASSPVADADVGIGFLQPGKTSFSTSGTAKKGKTNVEGKFTGVDRCLGEVGYNVNKPGYYSYTSEPYHFPEHRLGRWEPYDQTFKVVLKKIVNPVPMYVKHINVRMPAFNVPLGYDLSAGDWTSPYGKGVTADLIFVAELNKRAENDIDYKLTVSFPNKGDGIQLFEAPYQFGSALKSPREAPAEGYLREWVQTSKQRPGSPRVTSRDAEKHNYFLRVRTVLDQSGHVVKACYGKIYGDFMDFTYFLNPDTTRNLEYDVDHELMTGLQSFEKPHVP